MKKWLKVRGYTEHLEKVEEILTENQLDIIKALIGIFEIELDENKIKQIDSLINIDNLGIFDNPSSKLEDEYYLLLDNLIDSEDD